MTTPHSPEDLRRVLAEATAELAPATREFKELRYRGSAHRRPDSASRICALGAVASIALLLIGGAATLRPGPDRDPPGTGEGPNGRASSDPAIDEFTLPTMQLAQQLAEAGKDDPDFTNTAIDVSHRAIIVYRKSGQPDTRYTRIFDQRNSDQRRVQLQFRRAVLTSTETKKTIDAMLRAFPEFRRSGITAYSVNADSWGGPATVGVDKVTPQAVAIARRHAPYGPNTVAVIKDKPAQFL